MASTEEPSMSGPTFADIERNIARCRILLSALAMVAVYVDPTRPTLTRWLPLKGGPFSIDPYAFAVLATHLAYSVSLYYALSRQLVAAPRLAAVATWTDVLFGAAIALVTEGATSPFYAFFAFAVLTAGFRAGFRATMIVTAVSVALYLSLILVSTPQNVNFYIMRPAYLALTGYFVGYLGQQRVGLEEKLRHLGVSAQRQQIARSLHDGYVQALAGVNLRLGSCAELMRRGQNADAFEELVDLQASVNREHDELRAYIHSLAEREAKPQVSPAEDLTRFSVVADFSGSRLLVEHVLQILLEGIRNVSRHARAQRAAIRASAAGDKVRITMDDDGVGFGGNAQLPWSIASRVAECDGRMEVNVDQRSGAHLLIELPEV
jgi:signal transduction histidine kinase